jgi:TP53 regulating kinase-like protein
MNLIDSGAEAVIRSNGNLIEKERIPKSYRIKEIDEMLRSKRTQREAKVLQKLQSLNFPSPKLESINDSTILMKHIPGQKLRDVLYQDPLGLGRDVGRKVGMLHSNDIIHGDLTTSNMILDKEVHFIDFGLSNFSKKVEDKAVDLHLLRQALESKHHRHWEQAFKAILEGYQQTNPKAVEVLQRLEKVERRGRNKV